MRHEECPVATTLRYIGGKWKPIILFELRGGPLRSGELMRRVPQASAKMLTQQLRELECDGLVQRKIHRQVPPKVEYSLTTLGRSLTPVMNALCSWGKARQASGQHRLAGRKVQRDSSGATREPRVPMQEMAT